MPLDLVTWAPAVGGGGSDKYDPPEDSVFDFGPSGHYSATPSIAEINAGWGVNQIIALFNRRRAEYAALFPEVLSVPNGVFVDGVEIEFPDALLYQDADTYPTAATFNAIFAAIDALRKFEGFTAASWDGATTPAADTVFIARRHIGALRKALAIEDVCYPLLLPSLYDRTDEPWLTPDRENLAGPDIAIRTTGGGTIGKDRFFGGMDRYRILVSAAIRTYGRTISHAQAELQHSGSPEFVASPEVWNLNLYRSNTNDSTPTLAPAFGGSAYNTDNLEGAYDATLANVQQDLTIDDTALAAAADSFVSYILASNREVSEAGSETDEGRVLLTSFRIRLEFS